MDGGLYVNCATDNLSFIGLIFTVSKVPVFTGMCGVITRNFFQEISKCFVSKREGKEYQVIPEFRLSKSYLLAHNFRVSQPQCRSVDLPFCALQLPVLKENHNLKGLIFSISN